MYKITEELAAKCKVLPWVQPGRLRVPVKSVTLLPEMPKRTKRSSERLPDANLEVSRQSRKPHPEVQLVC